MKHKSAIFIVVILAASWAMAQGVDLSGAWKAKTVSARGSSEQTITFKQTGESFTGEMVNSAGVKETITDGKVSGNAIEFNVERKQASGEVSKVAYKGTVNGDEITGTFTGASGATVNWTAKKEAQGMSGMGGM
ncbi:MAG: hypothetical protein HY651_14315 [Acidobacteria bacterium]|nr:hypothetical protein [Acidobacteriota bacterium]